MDDRAGRRRAHADGVGPRRAVRRERGHVPRLRCARRANPGEQAPLGGLAHARALARCRRRPQARRHRHARCARCSSSGTSSSSAPARSTSPRSSSRRTPSTRATSGSARSSPRAESGSRSEASSARRRSASVGLRRHYVGSLVLMGVGWGAAALSGSIWLAVPFVVGGAAGNGAAIVCNRLLVQRGAPDQYRGRALATIMSSNYAVLGLSMAAAGVLTDVVGARAVWIGGGRDLPVRRARRPRDDALASGARLRTSCDAIEASSESAVAALRNGRSAACRTRSRARTGPHVAAARAHRGAARGDRRRAATAEVAARAAPVSDPRPNSSRGARIESAVVRKELDARGARRRRARRRPARARARDLARRERRPARLPARSRALSGDRRAPPSSASPGPPGVGKSSLIGALVAPRPRARPDGRRRLGRSVEPVLARRAARRPHPALRSLPRSRRLHPLDGDARAPRRARRGDARRRVLLLDASGKDVVFVETVGAGQSEVEVIGIADTVLLVLMPGSGDSVQALKAGIMEIPDVIAINKMDHPAAKTMLNEVRSIVALAEPERRPAILLTEALRGENVPGALGRRSRSTAQSLESDGRLEERRRREPRAPRCSRSRRAGRRRISRRRRRRPGAAARARRGAAA